MTLTAGRELDALIAEKVMGIEIPCRCIYDCEWLNQLPFDNLDNCQVCGRPYPFAYSTQIAAAWEVFQRIMDMRFSIRRKFFQFLLEEAGSRGPNGWHPAGIWVLQVLRQKFPEAICRAALKAVDDHPRP